MPKSNKTQTIIMSVGFAGVVIMVLVIIMMTLKNNPFASDRAAAEIFTDDAFNYRFRKFEKDVWTEDKKLQRRCKISGFLWKRSRPDAWIGLHVRDYVKKNPRPNELASEMREKIRRGLTNIDSLEPIKQTISEIQVDGVRFQGEYDGSQVLGEAYAFHNKGIGYILLYFATIESWEAAKPELDSYVKSFEFASARQMAAATAAI